MGIYYDPQDDHPAIQHVQQLNSTSQILASRRECAKACRRFNEAGSITKEQFEQFWNVIMRGNRGEMFGETPIAETALQNYPVVSPPIHIEHGTNICLGSNVLFGPNCTIFDSWPVSIGSQTKIGSNVSLLATTPAPCLMQSEAQKSTSHGAISIGRNCDIGDNTIILGGVTIGDGCIVTTASILTTDIPPYHLVLGNPARIVRKIEH